jgi:hypothetical protein
MELSDQDRRSYLKDEYLFLQSQYEDFDRRSLTIKGWFSGGAVAAIGLSFNASPVHGSFVLVAVAAIAAVFWYLEACWKVFQYALSDRIQTIEAYFRGGTEVPAKIPDPFQIYKSWFQSYSNGAKPRQVAFQSFVCLPYVVFIALSIMALVLRALPFK